jgi:hypothetical protein
MDRTMESDRTACSDRIERIPARNLVAKTAAKA